MDCKLRKPEPNGFDLNADGGFVNFILFITLIVLF